MPARAGAAIRGREGRVSAIARGLLAVLAACAVSAARAEDELNVICSVPLNWCEATASAFFRQTGVKVNLTQKAAGDALAQLTTERANPRHDVWYGGTADSHLRAAALGLTAEYKSPMLPQLHDWAVREAAQSNSHAVGIYTGALGIAYNGDVLAKKQLPAPACWSDLAHRRYRGELAMADPHAPSGAGYETLAVFVQMFGDERAFVLLKEMHGNVRTYARTEAGAMRAAARGEVAIAVAFLHDAVTEIANGFPIRLVVPCEGAAYDVGSMSLVEGARNPANARRFYDWALQPSAQEIGADTRNFQMPSNRSTPIHAGAPTIAEIRLIPYDYAAYGRPAVRRGLLERWDHDVRGLPR
jgi:iron(III) transport system substrate-binding protein